MTNNTQPEALRIADGFKECLEKVATELRRLHTENETLRARIKTMAEEHADELMVAHLDGRMRGRSTEPAGAQQPGAAYADLMQAASDWICEHVQIGTTGATTWAIRLQSAAQKLRASHGQAPAQAAPAAVHSDLRARCVELLAWRETGTLPGDALRTLAQEKYGDRYDALQRAERDTETEALNLVAAAPTNQPAPQQEAQYDHGPQAETVAEAARDVGKWLNERPNRPIDLRHVAMLDADEAKAEARHIGGTARAIPLHTAPQPSPASQGDVLTQAARDVLAERRRQISAEGWTQSHDDLEHEPGQLSSAAACYALNASAWLKRPYVSRADYAALSFINLSDWPWDGSWWKPKNERRDLVRAGALILAELERMDRADADRAARAPADNITAPAGGANWQDISTAPKDGTRFVAVGQNYGLDSEKQHTCIAQWLAGCWVEVSDWNGASKLKYLTHWMPLPPLPGNAAHKQGANHD